MKPGAQSAEQELEEILQFLYLMPVGVVRLGPDGAVEMINPKALQLLQDMDVDSGQADGVAILDAVGGAWPRHGANRRAASAPSCRHAAATRRSRRVSPFTCWCRWCGPTCAAR